HLFDPSQATSELPLEPLAGRRGIGRAGGPDVLQRLLQGRLPAVQQREAERTVVMAAAVHTRVHGAGIVVGAPVRRAWQAGDVGPVAVLVDAVATDLGGRERLPLARPENAVVTTGRYPPPALPHAERSACAGVARPRLPLGARCDGKGATRVADAARERAVGD